MASLPTSTGCLFGSYVGARSVFVSGRDCAECGFPRRGEYMVPEADCQSPVIGCPAGSNRTGRAQDQHSAVCGSATQLGLSWPVATDPGRRISHSAELVDGPGSRYPTCVQAPLPSSGDSAAKPSCRSSAPPSPWNPARCGLILNGTSGSIPVYWHTDPLRGHVTFRIT